MIALYRTSSGDAEPACRFCACSQSWLHSGVPQRQSLREIHKEPGQRGAVVPCHHLDRHCGNLLCFCHAEVRGCMTHLAAASSTYLRLSLPHRQHQARSSTGIHVHTGQRIRPSVAYRPRQYICSGNLLHFLDRLVTTRATPTQKLLVRLVIHPSIWVVVTMYFRHLGRHIGGYGSAPCTSLGLAISCG